jgi:hypothetical protein
VALIAASAPPGCVDILGMPVLVASALHRVFAMSALALTTDIERSPPHVRKVPTRDSCSAAFASLFDHFVGNGEQS